MSVVPGDAAEPAAREPQELSLTELAAYASGLTTLVIALTARLARHGLVDAQEMSAVFAHVANTSTGGGAQAAPLRQAAGALAELAPPLAGAGL